MKNILSRGKSGIFLFNPFSLYSSSETIRFLLENPDFSTFKIAKYAIYGLVRVRNSTLNDSIVDEILQDSSHSGRVEPFFETGSPKRGRKPRVTEF